MILANSKDSAIRFSLPVKIAAVLITFSALLVCIPRAVQAIPAEAVGPMLFFLLIPGILIYATFLVFTYQIQFRDDFIASEIAPNPFKPAFRCRFADICRIEQEESWISLVLYRYGDATAYRLPNVDTLESGPIGLLEEIRKHVPEEKIAYRIPILLKELWRWYAIFLGAALLAGASLASLLLLDAGGMLPAIPIDWAIVKALLSLFVLASIVGRWIFIWKLNRN